ncbi:MAG TPA: phosphoenolpyruvate carboxykinase (ATP) [Actinomycetota bacterium]|jgi:phosphoenolpyruvate carboxykinase (ATP)|nr:phosphoenolpyruvate carboxykinase (ATP) [Actinomycetota bacterium]
MAAGDLAGIAPGTVHRNPSAPELVEHAVRRGEATLAANGALVTETGARTGRSPADRFFVSHGEAKQRIDWGAVNKPVEASTFDALFGKVRDHLEGRELFVIDGYVGADPDHSIRLRVVTELAWHALFGLQLFRRPGRDELQDFEPDFTVVSAPTFSAVPQRDGTQSDAFIGLDLERKQVLICGTHYAGEMKKSIFTSANYLLPLDGVLPMHCSANLGERGDVALFFGLSGTGKTTLSADPARRLIGDDEHGWSDNGVFNFEGGCYAKCINLSAEKEPQIWSAIRFGSVVENVVVDPVTREVDYDDATITENTRAAYPLEYIPGFVPEGRAGHAETIVFLTADAFGVLPPISRLSSDAAMYHFLSGFTSKLAGTEAGVGSEPQATFSTCFGAPFLPLSPNVYATMLGERIERHGARVFLVNTGWTGGPYGVGSRMSLPHTRAMITAATSGELDDVETRRHPIFNLDVPLECPGVPSEVLDPQSTWDDPDAYEVKARELARMFAENFERFVDLVPPEVAKAGPAAD